MGPFEVVEKRPDEIALNRNTDGDCFQDLLQVASDIRYPDRILHLPVRTNLIADRSAVLSDVVCRKTVTEVYLPQHLIHALRIYLPAHFSELVVRDGRARGVLGFVDGVGAGDVTEIVIEA